MGTSEFHQQPAGWVPIRGCLGTARSLPSGGRWMAMIEIVMVERKGASTHAYSGATGS